MEDIEKLVKALRCDELDCVDCEWQAKCNGEPGCLIRRTAAAAWNRRAQPANLVKECPAMERVEGGIPYCSDRQTACDGCKPANEPLTLEELLEMDGEPVWIQPLDGSGCGEWAIVGIGQQSEPIKVYGFDSAYAEFSYGKTWLAYRRKPEHIRWL